MPSIYRPKHSVTVHETDVAQGANIGSNAHVRQGATSGDDSDWVGRRKAQPADILLPATRYWLGSLPAESRPQVLAKQFPRVANLVAASWDNPRDCSACIYSLLHDQRGGRRGFPHEVMEDIINLRMYYTRLHPIVDWDGGPGADSQRRRG